MTGAWHPDGRIYFVGGDYSNPFGGSYSQAIVSLSLAQRMAQLSNRNAGWQIDYPHCGGIPPQPKRPDYVGWQWDAKRGVFWFIPGTNVAGSTNCAGETANSVDDPNFLFTRIMTFNPATKSWRDEGAAAPNMGFLKTWQTVYDPVRDRFLQPWYSGGNGSNLAVWDPVTKTWSTKRLGPYSSTGQEIHIEHCYLAADHVARWIYAIDKTTKRLYRFSMDLPTKSGPAGGEISYIIEDLGLAPATDTEAKPVWDTVNQILLYPVHDSAQFFAYRPSTKQWETLGSVANNGVPAKGTVVFFDQANGVVGRFGEGLDPFSPSLPYLFLYRYSTSSGGTTQPSAASGMILK